MTTNPHTGLTEEEANVALVDWADTRMQETTGQSLDRQGALVFHCGSKDHAYDVAYEMPSQDLNLMKLITDAMTPEERMRFVGYLRKLVAPKPFATFSLDDMFAFVVVDASTRATAAIIALNLGKGERNAN